MACDMIESSIQRSIIHPMSLSWYILIVPGLSLPSSSTWVRGYCWTPPPTSSPSRSAPWSTLSLMPRVRLWSCVPLMVLTWWVLNYFHMSGKINRAEGLWGPFQDKRTKPDEKQKKVFIFRTKSSVDWQDLISKNCMMQEDHFSK